MRVFTSHLRADRMPLLVREGFSWGAFLFGFLYLAANRAWIPAVLNLAALLLAVALGRATGSGAPLLGLALLQGFLGRDLVRWGLSRRGFSPGPVVAGADHDLALAKLLGERTDLVSARIS